MNDNSDNWLTFYNYFGASFYFRRIKKHFCPKCNARLYESYTNSVSWNTSAYAQQLSKRYGSIRYGNYNVDERFYCFYCRACKEYFSFAEIQKLEAKAKVIATRRKAGENAFHKRKK